MRLDWEERHTPKFQDLSETINNWMYEIFHDKVREYYDKVLEDEDCGE
jgi:hypothetical protein